MNRKLLREFVKSVLLRESVELPFEINNPDGDVQEALVTEQIANKFLADLGRCELVTDKQGLVDYAIESWIHETMFEPTSSAMPVDFIDKSKFESGKITSQLFTLAQAMGNFFDDACQFKMFSGHEKGMSWLVEGTVIDLMMSAAPHMNDPLAVMSGKFNWFFWLYDEIKNNSDFNYAVYNVSQHVNIEQAREMIIN